MSGVSFMKIQLSEHGKKGVTDRQIDRQTKPSIELLAAAKHVSVTQYKPPPPPPPHQDVQTGMELNRPW